MEDQVLLEKWQELIEADGKAKAVPADLQEQMALLLENQEQYIDEGTVSGDIAQFTPILIPAVRRIFPNLLAHDIVGVQPLNAPTGYAYALRYAYGNTTANAAVGQTLTDRGASNAPTFKEIAVVLNENVTMLVGNNLWHDPSVGNTDMGEIIHSEPGAILVRLATAGTLPATMANGDALSDVSAAGGGSVDGTLNFYMNNEAGYNLIFKNYAGPMATADGEVLGAEMKSMKMTLERVAVEAQTRKMKAEYTVELAQDLKAVHGLDAESELINILEYEITAEIDRDLVDKINTSSTVSSPWAYAHTDSLATIQGVADGRWEQERFRTLYTKIVREANMVALTTRRGAGNWIIGSINAITALEGLNSFMYSAIPGDVSAGTGIVKVGTLDGRFTVYIDTFSPIDYITVGYKGASQFDTGVIYCPYVPLMMQKVVDPVTFQPKVGFMQRSATVNNLYGAENYYRRFLLNFDESSLEGSYF